MNNLVGLKRVKVIALSVSDLDRANAFYGKTLGLQPDKETEESNRWMLGDMALLLKPGWQQPTADPNPRLTVEVDNARDTESALRAAGVTLSDPVELYDDKFLLGSFLDSEGNKFWICSKV